VFLLQAGLVNAVLRGGHIGEFPLMKRLVSLSLAIVSCLCLIVASERRAWGYIDPGSGLLALQSIASVAAATTYFLRRKIKALFVRSKPEQTIVLPVNVRKNDSRNAA